MFEFDDLRELFIPGKGKVQRVPNRLAKGFLKKSIFPRRFSFGENKQGKREMARRVRQMATGFIKP